jgi:hypothetical protein
MIEISTNSKSFCDSSESLKYATPKHTTVRRGKQGTHFQCSSIYIKTKHLFCEEATFGLKCCFFAEEH